VSTSKHAIYQFQNLAERSEHQALVRKFIDKLKQFQEQTNDPWLHKWTYE